jgi:hypothetical protein
VKSETNAEEFICPSCQAPNASFASFCDSCGAPVGTAAALDPIQSINTQAFLFRKALEGRPKPIVLAGLWLMFFPALLGSIYAATYFVLNRTGLADFFFFWVFVGFAYVSSVILYRVTSNHLKARRETDTIHSSLGDE